MTARWSTYFCLTHTKRSAEKLNGPRAGSISAQLYCQKLWFIWALFTTTWPTTINERGVKPTAKALSSQCKNCLWRHIVMLYSYRVPSCPIFCGDRLECYIGTEFPLLPLSVATDWSVIQLQSSLLPHFLCRQIVVLHRYRVPSCPIFCADLFQCFIVTEFPLAPLSMATDCSVIQLQSSLLPHFLCRQIVVLYSYRVPSSPTFYGEILQCYIVTEFPFSPLSMATDWSVIQLQSSHLPHCLWRQIVVFYSYRVPSCPIFCADRLQCFIVTEFPLSPLSMATDCSVIQLQSSLLPHFLWRQTVVFYSYRVASCPTFCADRLQCYIATEFPLAPFSLPTNCSVIQLQSSLFPHFLWRQIVVLYSYRVPSSPTFSCDRLQCYIVTEFPLPPFSLATD